MLLESGSRPVARDRLQPLSTHRIQPVPRARARARLRCNNSRGTARLPHQTTRRGHVMGTKGTFWAHLCPSADTLPLVAIGENAGRPACLADGSTVDRGAPKGIRNLTCQFQTVHLGLDEHRIIAAHGPFPAASGISASRAISPGFGPCQVVFGTQGTRMARGRVRADIRGSPHLGRSRVHYLQDVGPTGGIRPWAIAARWTTRRCGRRTPIWLLPFEAEVSTRTGQPQLQAD